MDQLFQFAQFDKDNFWKETTSNHYFNQIQGVELFNEWRVKSCSHMFNVVIVAFELHANDVDSDMDQIIIVV